MSLDPCVLDILPKAVTMPRVVKLWDGSFFWLLIFRTVFVCVQSLEEKILGFLLTDLSWWITTQKTKMWFRNPCNLWKCDILNGKMSFSGFRIFFPPGPNRYFRHPLLRFAPIVLHLRVERPEVRYTNLENRCESRIIWHNIVIFTSKMHWNDRNSMGNSIAPLGNEWFTI